MSSSVAEATGGIARPAARATAADMSIESNFMVLPLLRKALLGLDRGPASSRKTGRYLLKRKGESNSVIDQKRAPSRKPYRRGGRNKPTTNEPNGGWKLLATTVSSVRLVPKAVREYLSSCTEYVTEASSQV